jgi:signal transduction histidine kinase
MNLSLFCRILIPAFVFTLQIAPSFSQTEEDLFLGLIEKARAYRYENFDSALVYIKKAENMALEAVNRNWLLKVRGQQGGIFYINGSYSQSLNYYLEAYQLALDLGEQREMAIALNGRALIALSQHDYYEAKNFLESALAINLELDLEEDIIRNFFNLGIALSDMGRYEEALQRLWSGKQLAIETEDHVHLNMIRNRLGRLHFESGKLDSAAFYYQGLIEEEDRISNWEKTFAYTGMAEVAFALGDFEDAIFFGERGFQIALDMGVLWDIQRATNILSLSYEKRGAASQALEYARLNKLYGDSLYNRNKSREISFLKLQMTQAENQQLLQEKEIMEQKSRFGLFFSLGLVFLVILLTGLLLAFRRNLVLRGRFANKLQVINQELKTQKRQISEQNKALNAHNMAKNKLFTILSHDLKSPINTLKQFLVINRQAMMPEEDLKRAMTLLFIQVDKTEKLMENLLHWSKSQMEGIQTRKEPIALVPFVEQVIDTFQNQCLIKEIQVDFQPYEDEDEISFDSIQLGVVIQNIFNNAIKFTPKGGKISLKLFEEEAFMVLQVHDTGKGMDEKQRQELEDSSSTLSSSLGSNKEMGTGLGLLLVKQFIQQNGGKFKVNSELGKGTTVLLYFEKANKPVDSEPELVFFSSNG